MTGAHEVAADLAARFRLNKQARSWRGDCPACSYPRAFSIRVGEGSRPALFCANGCTRDALNDAAQRALGGAWTPAPRQDATITARRREAAQQHALRLWEGSAPASGSPAGLYLAERGIAHSCSAALRYREDCPHPEGGRRPAMMALVHDPAGRPIAIHRTYITRDGRKAAVNPVKASLGPVWGGAIRLAPAALEVVVGEGIETATSAGLLLGLPVAWAAISAGNLATGLVLPPDVRAVVIAADPDPSGRKAAQAAAARWQAEGRRVRIATPDMAGQDFNDLLQARRRAEAPHG
jgi:putative DNA primase/helicase